MICLQRFRTDCRPQPGHAQDRLGLKTPVARITRSSARGQRGGFNARCSCPKFRSARRFDDDKRPPRHAVTSSTMNRSPRPRSPQASARPRLRRASWARQSGTTPSVTRVSREAGTLDPARDRWCRTSLPMAATSATRESKARGLGRGGLVHGWQALGKLLPSSPASRPMSEPGLCRSRNPGGRRDLRVGCRFARSCTSSDRPRARCWSGRKAAGLAAARRGSRDTPPFRPIQQRRGCRRRWLLRRASDSHARLQVTTNRAASKHLGVSGNYGKRGRRRAGHGAGRPTAGGCAPLANMGAERRSGDAPALPVHRNSRRGTAAQFRRESRSRWAARARRS